MAEDDDDAFTFGEFNFAPFPSQPQINGITSTSKYDDVWSDFFINPSPPPSSPIQPQSNPSNWDKPTSIGADPTPFKSSNPKTGALPLSLFGEVEEEDDDHGSSGNTNGWFNPNPSSQIKKVGVFNDNKNNVVIKSGDGLSLNLDGVGPDLIVDNNIMKNNDDEDDEWGAFSGHGIVEQGNFKEQGGSILSEFGIGFSGMIEQEKQAGQDASNSVDHEPGVISFTPQSIDFFAASNWNGANHLFSETDVDNKSTANTTNGFMWDPFPAAEDIGNGNGMDANLMNQDDDDFGDFIDASREVGTKEQDQVGAHMSPAEVQLPNGEVQEKQTQTRQSRGALPLSLFSDDTEESSDCLNLQNVGVVHIPTLNPVNSFGDKGSVVSINDLISNLYSQAQVTSSDKSSVKPEYEVQSPPKVTIPTPLEGNDDWDDGSWEYQGAISENEIGEHLSAAVPVYLATKQSEILPDLKIYIDFYSQYLIPTNIMAHNSTNRRKLAIPDQPPKRHPKPSTTATSTVYNLTNHFSRLHPIPKPTYSQNPPPHKHIDSHLQAQALSKSANLNPSNPQKYGKQGKRVVSESGKNKSLVVVEEMEKSSKELGGGISSKIKVVKPSLAVNGIGRRRSFCDAQVELANFLLTNCAKVVSADMPPFMQIHAVGFARKIKDSLEKFNSKNLALSLKKELDGVYGPAWHCIVGTSFGSFVTHSVGGFLYFSLDQKLFVLLFKTTVQRAA